jgi:hypothetical protein
MEEQRTSDSRGGVGEPPPDANSPFAFVSPLLQEADQAFRRDLAQLLKERPGQWVAYHGAERIGFAPRKPEMYQVCRDRGFDLRETLVTCIEPEEVIIFSPGAIWDIFFSGQG